MAITYVNRKQSTYYLHEGKTKTGKPKYFFSMKAEGTLAETIPKGYQIYENPNGQVFLRKIQPQLITDEELAVVQVGMEAFAKVQRFLIDVKKDAISIFTPDQDIARLAAIVTSASSTLGRGNQAAEQILERSLNYSSDLRFVLVDQEKRLFQTERYCYLGSIDDWMEIGPTDTLQKLVKAYVKHLDQESFFELH
jgi:hypothetical protein